MQNTTASTVSSVLARLLPCWLMLFAHAQSVVVPQTNASVLGTSQLNTIVRDAGEPRTYQYGIAAAELATVPIGATITGVSLRFSATSSNPASWPPAPITWPVYAIFAGPSRPFAQWGTTPLQNFAGLPQLVRSGPLTLGVDTYVNPWVPGQPNPWGAFFFDFETPYIYQGGDLALVFSHPGSNSAQTARFLETVPSSPTTHGVARAGPGFLASAVGGTGFYVMRVHYGYGIGCATSSGDVPVLIQDHDVAAATGGEIGLQIVNVAPGAVVAYAFGSSPANVSIGGCGLLLTPDLAVVVDLADGFGRSSYQVPVAAGVAGAFFVQAAVLDPILPLGFATSNAVSPTVQ